MSDNYRPEIDGLRALAVIAVIINHFSKDILPNGYLGVDVFFVISGYVITASLSNREYNSLGDFLLELKNSFT
jgi:peptidoglycan/LPS O-acetylase OafA/YrhL